MPPNQQEDAFTLKETLQAYMIKNDEAIQRIETGINETHRRIDKVDDKVNNMAITQAENRGKLAIMIIILGASATTVGAVIASIILLGVNR